MAPARAGDVEVFLDEQPGETRGIIARDGRFETLLIQRESDMAAHRLGARSIGRVVDVDKGLNAAFVDLGGEPPMGFLPLQKGSAVREGMAIEVVVTAEPRERKGPALRLIGAGEGEPRLLAPAPTIADELIRLAPGVAIQTGVAAIQGSWDAEEEALADGDFYAEAGLDLAVQRTRALIAVDIDYVGVPGQDGRKGRAAANRLGLGHAARLIGLKRWGGLVAIDLVGVGHDAGVIGAAAKAAFGSDPEIAYGPLNRFGVLQLALPWRRRPVEDVLNGWDGGATVETRALDVVRRLRHAMLSDTTAPRFTMRCAPAEAALALPLVARLGPRARLIADPGVSQGRVDMSED
ncbi:ribonuclease E/G [soil metagenome]